MSANFELIAESRVEQGKGASRRLRREGKVPAIIYGAGKEPQSITLIHKDLVKDLESEAFYTALISVKLDGTSQTAILRDVQRHPAKPFIMHIDLLRVDADQPIHVHVPFHFLNEEDCAAVKLGATVSHLMVEAEVICLPGAIPEFIEVDLNGVEVGHSVHLSELTLPEGVVFAALTHGDDHDLAVVSLNKPRGGAAAEEAAE